MSQSRPEFKTNAARFAYIDERWDEFYNKPQPRELDLSYLGIEGRTDKDFADLIVIVRKKHVSITKIHCKDNLFVPQEIRTAISFVIPSEIAALLSEPPQKAGSTISFIPSMPPALGLLGCGIGMTLGIAAVVTLGLVLITPPGWMILSVLLGCTAIGTLIGVTVGLIIEKSKPALQTAEAKPAESPAESSTCNIFRCIRNCFQRQPSPSQSMSQRRKPSVTLPLSTSQLIEAPAAPTSQTNLAPQIDSHRPRRNSI